MRNLKIIALSVHDFVHVVSDAKRFPGADAQVRVEIDPPHAEQASAWEGTVSEAFVDEWSLVIMNEDGTWLEDDEDVELELDPDAHGEPHPTLGYIPRLADLLEEAQ